MMREESHPQDSVRISAEQAAAEAEVDRRVRGVLGRKVWWRVGMLGGIILLGALGLAAAFGPNVRTEERQYLYIDDGTDFTAVMDSIESRGGMYSGLTFSTFARMFDYPDHIRPGRYLLEPGMSNFALLRNLKGGRQYPVKLVVPTRRSMDDLAGILTRGLKLTRYELLVKLNDTQFLSDSLGMAPDDRLALFVPNTYEVYWNTSAEDLLMRLKREYDNFWTEARLQKAKQLKLTPLEASIIASIVEEETSQNDEKPRIAGVYLNRLREDWKLQADPTVRFAVGDFMIRRVRYGHLATDSPYNTYMYKGLPPGPINNPSIASIDAVLNAEDHDYFYFVADLDRPGYHAFSGRDAFKQHVERANKYREELDELGID